MGGAFVEVRVPARNEQDQKARDELSRQVTAKLEEAQRMGLTDIRAMSEVIFDAESGELVQGFQAHS